MHLLLRVFSGIQSAAFTSSTLLTVWLIWRRLLRLLSLAAPSSPWTSKINVETELSESEVGEGAASSLLLDRTFSGAAWTHDKSQLDSNLHFLLFRFSQRPTQISALWLACSTACHSKCFRLIIHLCMNKKQGGWVWGPQLISWMGLFYNPLHMVVLAR